MFAQSQAFSGFSVNDIAAAKRFYGQTLGLDARDGQMGDLELHLGSGAVVFVYPKADHQPATYTVLNFPVSSVERAVGALTDAGVAMEYYDLSDIKTDEHGIARSDEGPTIAWFRDPAGNILSVLEASPVLSAAPA